MRVDREQNNDDKWQVGKNDNIRQIESVNLMSTGSSDCMPVKKFIRNGESPGAVRQ
jgi:hypothetical protein